MIFRLLILTLILLLNGCGRQPDYRPVLLLAIFFIGIVGLVCLFTLIFVQSDRVKELKVEQEKLRTEVHALNMTLENLRNVNNQLVNLVNQMQVNVSMYPEKLDNISMGLREIPGIIQKMIDLK